jgi:hypothetical protein
MAMHKTESEKTSAQSKQAKQPFFNRYTPLIAGGVILASASLFLGYSIGHRQGLTVVGYDADAQQLAEVVQKQKTTLDTVNKNYNIAIQERDVAVTNANQLFGTVSQAKADKAQIEGMSLMYREVLRERGGLSLTIQNLGIKPLPDNAYEYQVDLIQVSPNKRRASGNVELRLINGTEILLVPMEDSRFNFEDYERLTGRWTMPKGFNPQFIEVRITGTSTPTIKRFSWQRGQQVESPSAFISEIPQVEAKAQ